MRPIDQMPPIGIFRTTAATISEGRKFMTMPLRCFLPAAIVFLASPPALAHGPTRQKLELSVEVEASPDKVWAVIGNFHDLSWVPAVAKVDGPGGNDPDTAKRAVTLKSGGSWRDEELSDYDGAKFTYGTFLPHVDVKVLPVADFSSHISVKAEAGGKSLVEWRSAFYRGYPNNDPPPDLNEAAAKKAVTDFCQPALDGLKARFGAKH
jgi:hypothetical protein